MGNQLTQCYQENSEVVTQIEKHLNIGTVNENVEQNPAQAVIRDVTSLVQNLKKLKDNLLPGSLNTKVYNVRRELLT